MDSPEQRLKSLGITLPAPARPVANYVPWVRTGHLVYVSGQLPLADGKLTGTGLVGKDIALNDAKLAARQSAINIIAHVRDACGGNLGRVERVVKLTGFVASAAGFADHPQVVNGASDLMVECFGDAGRHSRSSVGVSSLPLNACVEVEAIIEVHGD